MWGQIVLGYVIFANLSKRFMTFPKVFNSLSFTFQKSVKTQKLQLSFFRTSQAKNGIIFFWNVSPLDNIPIIVIENYYRHPTAMTFWKTMQKFRRRLAFLYRRDKTQSWEGLKIFRIVAVSNLP